MKKPLTILATAALLLACTASPTTATDQVKPSTLVMEDGNNQVYRFCDSGRLIYVLDAGTGGGIAISDMTCSSAD